MAFRGNQNRNRNFGGNYSGSMGGGGGGGGANRMGNLNMSPWDTQNSVGNFGNGGGGGGGGMRQGGGGQGGQMNAQALNLANNLLNNLFRNQHPPSLMDLPRGGGGGGGGMGNRNQRGGGGPMINRGGGNRMNNRRGFQGGFPYNNNNRGPSDVAKPNQKQGGGGIRKQNSFDRAKKVLAKNSNSNANTNANANNSLKRDLPGGDKKNEKRVSPYTSVPNDMFYCHLCKKHMWDANSFENHIKGRTHLMMREGIEESYRLKANMIRQEAKIAEQLKAIELDRLKRMGKSKQRQLEYCTMCDLHFHGHISAHRKSEGHLQLKKFLHPKCTECNKEFATRIDFDSHILSADHLIMASEKNVKVGERKCNTVVVLTEEDEIKDLRQPQKRKKNKPATVAKDGVAETTETIKKEAGEEGANAATEGATVADETQEGDDNNETQEDDDAMPPADPEDCILDYVESEEIPVEVENRLPKYNCARPVGSGFITKLNCFECSLCGKCFDTEKTVEIHSRTSTHHRNFIKFINEKSNDTKIAQKRAAAATEENDRKRRKLEEADSIKNGEVVLKTETKSEEQDDDADGDGDGNGDAEAEDDGENGAENATDVQEEENEDMYDPTEATGDDEEMAENDEQSAAAEAAVAVPEPQVPAVAVPQTPTKAAVEPVTSTPVQVKVEAKEEPVTPAKTPAKAQAISTPTAAATPVVAATPSPQTGSAVPANNNSNNNTPVQNQQGEQANNSNKKVGGPRGGGNTGQGRGALRGRGRGRYNRY